MGCTDTFIAVAEDCRATTGEVPPDRGGGPTVAAVQYALLAADPGRWTQEDVLLASSPVSAGGHRRSKRRRCRPGAPGTTRDLVPPGGSVSGTVGAQWHPGEGVVARSATRGS